MTQSQIQLMEQVRQNAPETAGEGLELAQQNMVQMQTIAEGALTDPVTFRMRQGTNRPETAPEHPEEPKAGECGQGNNSTGDCTPQEGNSTNGHRGPGSQP
jgi:hypothetical protein